MAEPFYDQQYFEGATKRGGRNIANDFFRKFLLNHCPGRQSLLEIGCAKGEFLNLLEADFRILVGIDISEYAIEKSRGRLKKAKTYKWDMESGSAMPFDAEPFDVICSMHTFEHFYSPKLVLRTLTPLLKSDGVLIILVPNPNALKLKLVRLIDPKNRYYIFDDETHYSMHDRNTWSRIINEAGFNVKSYGRPFYYLKKSWLDSFYGDNYYNQGRFCETGPELVFVCRKNTVA